MSWTEPKYSKKAIGRAGETLISAYSEEEYLQALTILDNWRSSHAYPLNNIQNILRYKAKKIDSEALISQRLKRIISIRGKLKRFPSMRLDRMQDLGGCRVVLSSIDKVYKLRESLVDKPTKNKLIKENDYISNPKHSGYRGIHLIYKYGGKKDSIYDRHLIEIQIRTQIQHAWATTVEIVGAFTKEALKSGEGSAEWLKFFELVSILFSNLEKCTPQEFSREKIANIQEEVIDLANKLYVLDKLQAFVVSTKELGEHFIKSGYFLLILDIESEEVSVTEYSIDNLDIAAAEYSDLEAEYSNDDNIDIVLVSAESIRSLKKAYPNYFADSDCFLENLHKVLE